MSPRPKQSGKIPGKAQKSKAHEELAKARLANAKSEEERLQLLWGEEMEDIRSLITSERHRRRVSMATFPQTGIYVKGRAIKLAHLKHNHRGVQYAGRAHGFVITMNMHPGAHAGSKNAAENLMACMSDITRLVVWSEVAVDLRMVTHFEWEDGQMAYPQRFIKQIVVINAEGQPKVIPWDACWYVIDKKGNTVKYEG